MALRREKIAHLGQVLIRLNKITPEQLKQALIIQKEKYPDKLIGEVFLELGYVSKDELYTALAIQFLYPYIDISRYKLNKEVIALIPKEIALRYKVMPLDKFGDILTLVIFNPLDKEAIDVVADMTGCQIRTFVASREELEQALELVYK